MNDDHLSPGDLIEAVHYRPLSGRTLTTIALVVTVVKFVDETAGVSWYDLLILEDGALRKHQYHPYYLLHAPVTRKVSSL